MQRPGLKRLLADIEAGKVDVVLLYKIDRLTRSLTDFARIVEVLDKADASFVSITQSFNTTTSMGRLTLNMLLSFAQFEHLATGFQVAPAERARRLQMHGLSYLWTGLHSRAERYCGHGKRLLEAPARPHRVNLRGLW